MFDMKIKVISLFLAFLLVFSCIIPAVAADDGCDCDTPPVVTVRGFGSMLFTKDCFGRTVSLYPLSLSSILFSLPYLVFGIGCVEIKKDDLAVKYISKGLDVLVGKLKVDNNGDSVNELILESSSPADVDTHRNSYYSFTRRAALNTGDYQFKYDWRLDPVVAADGLNEYIEQIKKTTGHSKVIIVAHSEGNNVVASYLTRYGHESVSKLLFMSAAFNGITLVGKMMNREIYAIGKADEFMDFIRGYFRQNNSLAVLTGLFEGMYKTGVLAKLLDKVGVFLENNKDAFYDSCLVPLFGTYPGFWSFVPDEYYEDAKQNLLGNAAEYSALFEKTDYYQHEVRGKLADTLRSARDSGVEIMSVCGYGIRQIPVYKDSCNTSDFLIDTKYMSFGATCAPVGTSLESAEGKYLSPDGEIDASTCLFPDTAWFVKYQEHNDFCNAYCDFLDWLISSDEAPTVFTSERYPQFMICDAHMELSPVK